MIFTTCVYIFQPQFLNFNQPGWHWIYFCLFESQYREKHTNSSLSREIYIISNFFTVISYYYFFPQDSSLLWSWRNVLQLFSGWMRLLSAGTLPHSFWKYEDVLLARRKRGRESLITCSESSFLKNRSVIYTYNHVNCRRQCLLHRSWKLYFFKQANYLSFKN